MSVSPHGSAYEHNVMARYEVFDSEVPGKCSDKPEKNSDERCDSGERGSDERKEDCMRVAQLECEMLDWCAGFTARGRPLHVGGILTLGLLRPLRNESLKNVSTHPGSRGVWKRWRNVWKH